MLILVGAVIVLASTLGGFMLAGGHPMVLLHVSEFVVILGVAAGVLVIASPGHILKEIVHKVKHAILGKPAHHEEATSMLARLSGRTHEVRTRFAIGARPGSALGGTANDRAERASHAMRQGDDSAAPRDGAVLAAASVMAPLHAETVSTLVHFRTLDADEIRRYVATGEGMDKAGSYAVQGMGSFAVERIEGSYANVVGLPVCEVVVALKRLGVLRAFP